MIGNTKESGVYHEKGEKNYHQHSYGDCMYSYYCD